MIKPVTYCISLLLLFLLSGCEHTPDPIPEPLAKPSNLAYTPNSITLTAGTAGSSATPTYDGESISGFILVVNPFTNKITVNSEGKILIADNTPSGTYQITVLISNPTGTSTFDNIYTVTVNP